MPRSRGGYCPRLSRKLDYPLSREELAWAAGFFDGEGTAVAYTRENAKGVRYRAFTMAVSQAGNETTPEVLSRFLRAVGGIGAIYQSSPYKHTVKWQRRWQWQSGNFETVQAVTAMLWPWLSGPKKEQLSNALRTYLGWPRVADSMTSERGRKMANQRWGNA